jgi:hypothetical protein
MIRRAIEIGHRKGFITFDQLNELVGTDKIEPEDIETLMEALSAEGIQVIDEQSGLSSRRVGKAQACPPTHF